MQVATLLTMVDENACEVYSIFTNYNAEGDETKLELVQAKFEQHCYPRRNVPFNVIALIIASRKPGKHTNNIVRLCIRWHKSAISCLMKS